MMKPKMLIASVLTCLLLPVLTLAADVDQFAVVKAVVPENNMLVVPLEVANTKDLAALDIPLEYSSGATLVEVEFTERVANFEFKHASIDAENNRVIIGMLTMVTQERPDLTPGAGTVANLHFRLDPGVETVEIKPIETQNPNHSLAYYYNDYSTGRPIVKVIRPELSFAPVSLNDGRSIPTEYALDQNWPNPFNPATTLKYSLPKAGEVTLNVFNILGQQVTTLVNGFQEAGTYEVIWNGTDDAGDNVASGIYFYRVKVNDFTQTKKMLMVK